MMRIGRDALIIAWVLGAAYILSPNQPRIKPIKPITAQQQPKRPITQRPPKVSGSTEHRKETAHE